MKATTPPNSHGKRFRLPSLRMKISTLRSSPIDLRPKSLLIPILVLLSLASGCGDSEVTTVATQDEAIEILSVLYDDGIDANMQEVGDEGAKRWKILVEGKLFEGGIAAKAHRVLRDNGLPRPTIAGREEAAREEGLLKSPSAEKAKRLKEMEIEIERQLRLLPGVVRVKTNVAPAEDDPVELNPPPATAAVVIVCKDRQPGFTDQHVKELVAGGVPRLRPENVRVATTYEPPHPPGPRAIDRSRRNRIVSGIVLVSLLTIAFVGLLLVARRKRGRSNDERSSDSEERAGEDSTEFVSA